MSFIANILEYIFLLSIRIPGKDLTIYGDVLKAQEEE